ncbi:hypothetical protein E4U38_004209 [Claviceps purpurea]|nr:hypothetical protein E4U38_004209 [Claviceps purpurea]
MATSILRRTCKPLANRLAWKPLAFPSEGFAVIPADERVEEETLPNYATSQYYPVAIGEIFRARYQVVGKLGFGTTSTVWLARDLSVGMSLLSSILDQGLWLDRWTTRSALISALKIPRLSTQAAPPSARCLIHSTSTVLMGVISALCIHHSGIAA